MTDYKLKVKYTAVGHMIVSAESMDEAYSEANFLPTEDIEIDDTLDFEVLDGEYYG
jgi:translation initiation factor 6 (eIF-6)